MKKIAIAVAALSVFAALPANAQSMSRQAQQSEGMMKYQEQHNGAPRGRGFRFAFNRMGHHHHYRHHHHR